MPNRPESACPSGGVSDHHHHHDDDEDRDRYSVSIEGSQVVEPEKFRLSKRRWAVLFALFCYGFTSGLSGETSSIFHTLLHLLGIDEIRYVYISQFFIYIPAVTTIPIAFLIDRRGIKTAMYLLLVMTLIHNSSKALLFDRTTPRWNDLKFVYWIISSVSGLFAAIIFWCLPLKVSETWFAASERSVAWTLMVTASTIGSSIAAFVQPRVIHGVDDLKPLAYLNIATALLNTLTIPVCMTKSEPEFPPNERTVRSKSEPMPYFKSIREMIRNKNILLLMFYKSIFEGAIFAVLGVLQDILTSVGHSEIFVGDFIAIKSAFSAVVGILLARHVHRVKNITMACKLACLIEATLFILYLLTLMYPIQGWIIIVLSLFYVTGRGWSLPNYNNMMAHLASGTISEANISGFGNTIGSITISLSSVIFVSLTKTRSPMGKYDYTYSLLYAGFTCLVNAAVFVLFFDGKGRTKRDGTISIVSSSE